MRVIFDGSCLQSSYTLNLNAAGKMAMLEYAYAGQCDKAWSSIQASQSSTKKSVCAASKVSTTSKLCEISSGQGGGAEDC